tara:strand:- start:529 stop:816 length:288 start_codon:yes stop_codon:yes gene_type:complete
MATATTKSRANNDIATIMRLVNKHARPKAIKNVEVVLGSDSSGAPAARIYFFIDNDVSPSAKEMSELSKFAETIRDDILKEDLEYWPYVRFRESP